MGLSTYVSLREKGQRITLQWIVVLPTELATQHVVGKRSLSIGTAGQVSQSVDKSFDYYLSLPTASNDSPSSAQTLGIGKMYSHLLECAFRGLPTLVQ